MGLDISPRDIFPLHGLWDSPASLNFSIMHSLPDTEVRIESPVIPSGYLIPSELTSAFTPHPTVLQPEYFALALFFNFRIKS